MSDYWRFSVGERLVLFACLLVQWTLLTLNTSVILSEHSSGGAGSVPLDSAYWLIVGGFTLALLVIPGIRYARAYGPDAYRQLKRRVAE